MYVSIMTRIAGDREPKIKISVNNCLVFTEIAREAIVLQAYSAIILQNLNINN